MGTGRLQLHVAVLGGHPRLDLRNSETSLGCQLIPLLSTGLGVLHVAKAAVVEDSGGLLCGLAIIAGAGSWGHGQLLTLQTLQLLGVDGSIKGEGVAAPNSLVGHPLLDLAGGDIAHSS